MPMFRRLKNRTGFTLIETLVVIAITVLIFGALLLSFQFTLKIIANSRAQTIAVAVANDRMEYFRSLPYNEVGTVSGIPSGLIPQTSTSTINGIQFTERVLVEYVDDPADGLLTATTTDGNGIPADYKRVKIEISWNAYNEDKSIFIISNIVPRSIETTDGGGTVRVNVIDHNSVPLPGASVTLSNNTTTTTISVTKTSDINGTVLFSGAPAASNYELVVTATISGETYSTAQTYAATTSNPNPSLAPFAVLEADISTLTMQIGALSDMDIVTYSAKSEVIDKELFTDATGIASSSNTLVSGGMLRLEDVAGVYDTSGSAFLTAVSPTTLEAWELVTVAADTTSNTGYKVRVYADTGIPTLIPDTDLPGNSAGFSTATIDISRLDTATYPSLPTIEDVYTFYRESSTSFGGQSLSIHGNKMIGTTAGGSPIYKFSQTYTTSGAGTLSISNLEFDSYTVTPPGGYMFREACPSHPISHKAGVDSDISLLVGASVTNSLRVSVVDASGNIIPGASVTVSRAGFSDTKDTSVCGQAFFSSGIGPHEDYSVEVTRTGYTTDTRTNVSASGQAVVEVVLNPS
jgi:type II secretory pathway pseudopilin PulG